MQPKVLPAKYVRGYHDAKTAGGRPGKKYNNIPDVVNDVFAPLVNLDPMVKHLEKKGLVDLVPLVPRYFMFCILLGMWRPRRVDDIWVAGPMCYHRGPAALLSRREYCAIHKEANVPITHMLHDINETWRNIWVFSAAATGHETIIPHKGKRAGPLRQFTPRKPRGTGVKFYVLPDAVHPFVTNVFLYVGPKAEKFVGRSGVAGDNNP